VFENRDFMINDFDYPSKKGKQGKDDVSMDQDSFIIYLSPEMSYYQEGCKD
jgi:hypothetical protein